MEPLEPPVPIDPVPTVPDKTIGNGKRGPGLDNSENNKRVKVAGKRRSRKHKKSYKKSYKKSRRYRR